MGIHERTNPRVVQLNELNVRPPVNIPSDSYTSDDASSVASEQPIKRPPRRIRGCKSSTADFYLLADRLQYKSRRVSRRQNQLSFVRTLVGLEEAEVEDEFLWSPDYGKSAFTSLFLESEKMKAWNRFVEMSEEDQLSVIKQCSDDKEEAVSCKETATLESNHQVKVTSSEKVKAVDQRSVHPCYSSDACFNQISVHIRQLLTRRHLPMGLLENLENEIREAFGDSPLTIYEPDVYSSFGRLLVHAITQYLGLEAISYNGSANTRNMSVVNKEKTFNPPEMLLTEYLDWNAGKQKH